MTDRDRFQPSDEQMTEDQLGEVMHRADLELAAELEEDRRTAAQPADDDD
jgi:hypothetical protein